MLNPVVSVNRGLQVSGDGTNKAQNRAAAQRHAGVTVRRDAGMGWGSHVAHSHPLVTYTREPPLSEQWR